MTTEALLLPETTLAIDRVKQLRAGHRADRCEDIDPQVLDYLTRYIVVLLCNEIERQVTSLLMDRIDEVGDEAVSRLVKTVRGGLLRNARPDSLGEALAKLDSRCKAVFEEELATIGESARSLLGRLVTKRNETTHTTQPMVRFEELITAVEAAEKIVAAVELAISITRRAPAT